MVTSRAGWTCPRNSRCGASGIPPLLMTMSIMPLYCRYYTYRRVMPFYYRYRHNSGFQSCQTISLALSTGNRHCSCPAFKLARNPKSLERARDSRGEASGAGSPAAPRLWDISCAARISVSGGVGDRLPSVWRGGSHCVGRHRPRLFFEVQILVTLEIQSLVCSWSGLRAVIALGGCSKASALTVSSWNKSNEWAQNSRCPL